MSDTARHVVLIHGLWYGRSSMLPLASRLQQHGWHTSRFGYAGVGHEWPRNVNRLIRYIADRPEPGLQLVAHSLGGLLALAALQQLLADSKSAADGAAVTRITQLIMLGSPIQGSRVVQVMLANKLARRAIGHSAGVLSGGVADLLPTISLASVSKRCRLVMLAGTRELGLGTMLTDLESPHDGTVAVAETRHPALHQHILVNTSHTGILLSRATADLVAALLQSGPDH